MAGNYYMNDDNTDFFTVPSTIDFPDMTQPDPQGGSFSAMDAAIGGYGTGGECLKPDGNATTRYKTPSASSDPSVVNGGTP